MSHAIVVLNSGPSRLRFSIHQITNDQPTPVAHGQIDGLKSSPSFKASDRTRNLLADEKLKPSFGGSIGIGGACTHVLNWMEREYGGVLTPVAIGHRIAHGGCEFAQPTLLTPEVIEKLDRLVALDPLHQADNLAAARALSDQRPDLPQVGCFDTGFHRGRARVAERFGLPDELFDRGVRRWGFHGLACTSIIDQLRETAPDLAAGRIIIAHFGDGATSMSAVRGGRSVDTTTGFSALDGLPSATRCGSMDAGAVLFLLESRGHREVETLLYRESGLLGISGVSRDLRELLASENPRAADAVEFFVYRAAREIGSLTAALGGLDALVFTAGVGASSPVIRQRICGGFGWLGVAVDPAANQRGRGCISPAGRSPSVWVIPADEERVIASGAWQVVRKSVAPSALRSTSAAAGIN